MGEKELLQLCCTVQSVVYRNENNGYSVISVMNNGAVTTAVGMMTSVSVGDELKLIGNWKVHSVYGKQFAFDCYEHTMPSDSESIYRYLSSGAIKGIGRATAKRIVAEFGDNALEVIKNEPKKLCVIKGISKERALEMSEEINKTLGMREIMMELGAYEISVQESVKIWKNYGSEAVEKIKENPYILCREGIGIEFRRADLIAVKLNMSADDEYRIRAGIIYVLSGNLKNGHTCLPKGRVAEVAGRFLVLEYDTVESVIEMMIKDGSIIQHKIDDVEFLFLPQFFQSESYSANRLKMMLEFPPESITGVENALDLFEKRKNIKYADLQRKAIIQALSGGLLILTGGPGTGKTTAINAIIELYKQSDLKVMLAAPTGRAAQRMSEVTGRTAKTIHRLLEVEWDKNDMPVFKRNERNMLECDALIIDELSMVDSQLFEAVLRALPLGCRLIMIGDSDQLPSVSAGNVLSDLISSGKIPCIHLTEIFRQSMQSLIVMNAHKIVNGEMPEITRKDNDFFFIGCHDISSVSDKIVELCSSRLPKAYHYSPLEDIQVLCPSRKGELLGVTGMNAKLQAVLNPKTELTSEIVFEGNIFRIGDKVMQIKNNYNILWHKDDGTSGTGVFNGDIGIITDVDTQSRMITVQFDDKLIEYEFEALNNLELAYAMTVHKSQGNEFNAVLIPIYAVPSMLCYRNLLYTAVTRAKKILILVGEVSVMHRMVENNRKTLRFSALKSLLNENE